MRCGKLAFFTQWVRIWQGGNNLKILMSPPPLLQSEMMSMPKLAVDIFYQMPIIWNGHAMSLKLKIGREPEGSIYLICHIKIQNVTC